MRSISARLIPHVRSVTTPTTGALVAAPADNPPSGKNPKTVIAATAIAANRLHRTMTLLAEPSGGWSSADGAYLSVSFTRSASATNVLNRYLRSVQGNQSGVATIVICTNRPARAVRTIDVVHEQSAGTVPIVVVDDCLRSSRLLEEQGAQLSVRVVRPASRGLSAARNAGWRAVTTPWVIYLDDDVVPEPGWLRDLLEALGHHPEVEIVSCDVRAPTHRGVDALAVTEHRVSQETYLQGRWLRPWMIGFTLCTAFRRTMLERLGGFDERLGPGTAFPSAEDMDLNYRFLRAGGVAFAAPRPLAVHEQWRDADELPEHFRRYMVGWTGFAIKHLRQGDICGGVWLWSLGLVDLLRMTASAARRRSGIRWRVARAKGRGLLQGTAAAARQRW